MNKAFKIIALAALIMGSPLAMMAEEMYDNPESEVSTVTISLVSSRTVRVFGAAGSTLEIYNLAGVKVRTYNVDSNDKTFEVALGRGCYMLKVGNVVRKISIK